MKEHFTNEFQSKIVNFFENKRKKKGGAAHPLNPPMSSVVLVFN